MNRHLLLIGILLLAACDLDAPPVQEAPVETKPEPPAGFQYVEGTDRWMVNPGETTPLGQRMPDFYRHDAPLLPQTPDEPIPQGLRQSHWAMTATCGGTESMGLGGVTVRLVNAPKLQYPVGGVVRIDQGTIYDIEWPPRSGDELYTMFNPRVMVSISPHGRSIWADIIEDGADTLVVGITYGGPVTTYGRFPIPALRGEIATRCGGVG